MGLERGYGEVWKLGPPSEGKLGNWEMGKGLWLFDTLVWMVTENGAEIWEWKAVEKTLVY